MLGVASMDGLIEAVADDPRSADGVARELDARAVRGLLSALGELEILGEKVSCGCGRSIGGRS